MNDKLEQTLQGMANYHHYKQLRAANGFCNQQNHYHYSDENNRRVPRE